MSQSSILNRYKEISLGSIIIFLYFSQLLICLKLDRAPMTWDPAKHLTDNHIYFQLLSHPSIHSLKKIIYLSIYPPFVGLSVLPLYFFFGESTGVPLPNFCLDIGRGVTDRFEKAGVRNWTARLKLRD